VSRSAAHAAHAHQELPEAIIQPRDVSEHPHPRMVWTIEPMRPCSIGEGSKLYAAEGAVSSDRLQSATTGPSFARIDLKIAVIPRHPSSAVANPQSIRDDAVPVAGGTGNGPKAAAGRRRAVVRPPYSSATRHKTRLSPIRSLRHWSNTLSGAGLRRGM